MHQINHLPPERMTPEQRRCEIASLLANGLAGVPALEADAAKGHEDAADRLQNLGQLVNNVKNYCDQHGEEATLEGYLEDIALISDIDSYNESNDQVVLMTIHSAKGLEFPYVFLIGMEEGVFPSEMSKYSEADLEEERRLAYVGITRAKKELYISNSVSRML